MKFRTRNKSNTVLVLGEEVQVVKEHRCKVNKLIAKAGCGVAGVDCAKKNMLQNTTVNTAYVIREVSFLQPQASSGLLQYSMVQEIIPSHT